MKLPIRSEPLVPWETNLRNWVCANDHGAKFGDNRDDTAAMQAAIDAAAAAGKTVAYLRGIGGGDPNWYDLKGEVRVHGSVRLIIGLGFGRVIGGDGGRFIVDDRSAPVVKFLHLQAFGGRPPAVENRSPTNTLVVESCDLKILGTGRGDIFVTDCPCGIELRSPGQRLWARQLNPEGDSDNGLVQNHGGMLLALGVKHEGRGVRFLTDRGGQTEILGLFNYAPSIAKEDPRPAFDVADADFSAAGVREIAFGNTFPVKVREVRAGDTRTEKGGGWIGWALFRSGSSTPGTKAKAAARPGPPPGKQWKLAWQDEFEGTTLDTNRWFSISPSPWTYPGFPTRASESNCVLNGSGHLVLQLTCDADGAVRYHRGLYSGNFEQAYGYFETRAQFSRQPGWWTAVWLSGVPYDEGTDPFVMPQEFDTFEDFLTFWR